MYTYTQCAYLCTTQHVLINVIPLSIKIILTNKILTILIYNIATLNHGLVESEFKFMHHWAGT